MRASATTINMKASTTAEMRASFATLSAALTEVGLVKHTTAGQINVATAELPSDIDARWFRRIGFEIRKMVATGLRTIYFRIDYCTAGGASANASTSQATYRITTGTGVDDDGVLTGLVSTSASTTAHANSASAFPDFAFPFYLASDGANYFTLAIDPANILTSVYAQSNSYSQHAFMAERSRSIDDAAFDDDGMALYCLNGQQSLAASEYSAHGYSASFKLLSFTLNQQGQITNPSSVVPNYIFAQQSLDPDSMTVFPILMGVPEPKAPGNGVVGYWAIDVPPDTIIPAVPIYAEAVDYVALGDRVPAYDGGIGTSYIRWALRAS